MYRKSMLGCLLLGTVSAVAAPAPGGIKVDDEKATVSVSVLKEDLLAEQLTYPARVVPRTNASVVSETDGMVTKVLVPLGQPVKRGQALVVVQHTDPAYDYAPVVLKAPVAGIVSQINVTPGNRVKMGEVLVSVMDPQNPRILMEITAADQRQITAGSKGEFVLTGGGGERFSPQSRRACEGRESVCRSRYGYRHLRSGNRSRSSQ